nr:hypothetical protein [Anaerotardibacter muris]
MKTGWQKVSGKWYYYGGKNDGAKKTGWQKVSGKWYYMDPTTTAMQTGKLDLTYYDSNWVQRGDVYYLTSSGAMKTGWNKESGKWYYYGSSGAMYTGTLTWISGKYYFFDWNGVMQTGLQKINDDHYYFNSSGAMKMNSWVKTGGKWYYTTSNGTVAKNRWIGGQYWVGSDGVMATSSWVDGGKYYVDKNGKWLRNAQPASKRSVEADTQAATNSDSQNAAA